MGGGALITNGSVKLSVGGFIKMHYLVKARSNSIGLETSCFAQKAISMKEWGWGHPFGIT